ncbi:MAG: O-antigen ligase family protein [Bacteroidetes bacterium]|nr:O-antigen ligase family protein [Bacteroidota bacterium]
MVRPAVGYILLFFMTYAFIRTKKEIKNLLTFITILLLITSVWGILQFFNGYLSFEMAYVMANDAVHLVYINGRWRSFGTMISPAQYGIVVAYLMVLVFILASRKMSFFLKMIYLGAGFAALFAMVYSGTRSAYVVVPLALITLVILGKNLKLYFIGAGFGVLFLVLIVTPSNNYQIQRIQSAFNGEHDESYMVRKRNQEMIRPWILAHPLGGGLGSTGVWGQKFSPGTFLAKFPPDSGYVRVAVELGWIGLIIYLIMIGKIMISGIFAYWKMTDPELKKIVLAILSMLAAISVVEYAQEVINKLPTNMLFWIFLGILFKSIQIEKAEQQTQLLTAEFGKVESK